VTASDYGTLFGDHYVLSLEMARLEGLEPPTFWFEAKCSIQLSYRRVTAL
jgi:hypothetical protein